MAKGFTQKPVDYTDTFSPVTRFETIRVLLAIAAQRKWTIKQFDIKTAFLNSNLKEKLYMMQPEGYSDNSNKVCKLLKGCMN